MRADGLATGRGHTPTTLSAWYMLKVSPGQYALNLALACGFRIRPQVLREVDEDPMKQLLSISTFESDLRSIGYDWSNARTLLKAKGFDGYELFPIGPYAYREIPADLVTGLHLRFFVIVAPLWNGDRRRLLEIFGDQRTVQRFYGGMDREAIIGAYRNQLRLAQALGCEYVVFHVSQCEPEYAFDWKCPWSWRETVDISAEIIHEVTRQDDFSGQILFENLWWPGSLRLDSPAEVEYLFQRVDRPRCGLVLDTGHILNKNQSLHSEAEGITYLLETVRSLGELTSLIKAVHLTRSLSGDYICRSQNMPNPAMSGATFWDRLDIVHRHVCRIDQHDAFEDAAIGQLFDLVSPDFLVFEFTYANMAEWEEKIDRQRRALQGRQFERKKAVIVDLR